MNGGVVQYGAGSRYVIDLGKQPRQRCGECGRTRWADRVALITCPHPGCNGRMVDEGLQRRQKALRWVRHAERGSEGHEGRADAD
jgi:hypothetical protein